MINGSSQLEIGINSDTTTYTDVAVTNGKAQFMMISYDAARVSQVTCTCDRTQEFDMYFVDVTAGPPDTFVFNLTSRHCCPGYTQTSGGSGLSTAEICIIGLASAVAVYLVVGMIIQTFLRKATGKQIIPHINFWTSLMGAIWSGVKYTVTCGRVKGGYQEV